MTSHSDYAKTREPKPMQVWKGRSPINGVSHALVLEISTDRITDPILYRKLDGEQNGRTFRMSVSDFTKFYQFSH